METYLLYSRGDILIFAVIMHKGAMREAIEIGKQILADAKEIESTSFILKHVWSFIYIFHKFYNL